MVTIHIKLFVIVRHVKEVYRRQGSYYDVGYIYIPHKEVKTSVIYYYFVIYVYGVVIEVCYDKHLFYILNVRDNVFDIDHSENSLSN